MKVYYGPPLLLTPDGGPQCQAANKVIQEWVCGQGVNMSFQLLSTLNQMERLNQLLSVSSMLLLWSR